MSKTTEAIGAYAANPDAIVEAGEVVDIRFQQGDKLSLRGAKLFHLLVQAAGVAIVDDKQHKIAFSELNESFHIPVQELEHIINELHRTVVSLKLTDEKGRSYKKSGSILSDVERESDDLSQAEIRFEFSKTMQKAIANSSHWAVLSRKAVLAFEGKYSLRLYTILSLRSGLRKTSEDFLLEDFRKLLGVPTGAYDRWNNFRQWVLAPALLEINQLGGVHVGFRPLKQGRKIIGVRLTWGMKDRESRVEALKELEASKVGRKARRTGQVSYIAEAESITRQAIALALSEVGQESGDDQ